MHAQRRRSLLLSRRLLPQADALRHVHQDSLQLQLLLPQTGAMRLLLQDSQQLQLLLPQTDAPVLLARPGAVLSLPALRLPAEGFSAHGCFVMREGQEVRALWRGNQEGILIYRFFHGNIGIKGTPIKQFFFQDSYEFSEVCLLGRGRLVFRVSSGLPGLPHPRGVVR